MHSFAVLSLIAAAAVVNAQDPSSASSAPSSTSTANPLIPTTISSDCSSFLQSFNSNSTLASCIAPVVNATATFSPLSNSTANATSTAVNDSLRSLCSVNTLSPGCSDAVIRSQLSSFYTACTDELTGASPNQDVIRIYDVLYTITPLKSAVCSKDDSGNYCVTQISPSTSSDISSASAPDAIEDSRSFAVDSKKTNYELVENNLWSYADNSNSLSKRAPGDENVAALIPNTTTFRNTNLPFFFLDKDTPSDALCTSCTRSVITAYITFEQTVPYALGIANSPLLGGQGDLYNAIVSECGASFLSGAVQAAGGLSGGLIGGAAPRVSAESGVLTAAAAAILGLVSLL